MAEALAAQRELGKIVVGMVPTFAGDGTGARLNEFLSKAASAVAVCGGEDDNPNLVLVLSTRLTSVASQWFEGLPEHFASVPDFVAAMRARFQAPNVAFLNIIKLVELPGPSSSHWTTASIVSFIGSFQGVLAELPNEAFSQPALVALLTTKLPVFFRVELTARTPATFEEAIPIVLALAAHPPSALPAVQAARSFTSHAAVPRKSAGSAVFINAATTLDSESRVAELEASGALAAMAGEGVSAEERRTRYLEGVCLRCGTSGHTSRYCPKNKKTHYSPSPLPRSLVATLHVVEPVSLLVVASAVLQQPRVVSSRATPVSPLLPSAVSSSPMVASKPITAPATKPLNPNRRWRSRLRLRFTAAGVEAISADVLRTQAVAADFARRSLAQRRGSRRVLAAPVMQAGELRAASRRAKRRARALARRAVQAPSSLAPGPVATPARRAVSATSVLDSEPPALPPAPPVAAVKRVSWSPQLSASVASPVRREGRAAARYRQHRHALVRRHLPVLSSTQPPVDFTANVPSSSVDSVRPWPSESTTLPPVSLPPEPVPHGTSPSVSPVAVVSSVSGKPESVSVGSGVASTPVVENSLVGHPLLVSVGWLGFDQSPVKILFDSGASHSFCSLSRFKSVARGTVQNIPKQQLRVRVQRAGGVDTVVDAFFANLPLRLHGGLEELCNVLVLPDLGRFELILGLPWLAAHTWRVHFQSSTMSAQRPDGRWAAWSVALDQCADITSPDVAAPVSPQLEDPSDQVPGLGESPSVMSLEAVEAAILTAKQAARLIRKSSTKGFWAFPHRADPSDVSFSASVHAADAKWAGKLPPVADRGVVIGSKLLARPVVAQVLERHEAVFPMELPSEMPPERGQPHKIEVIPGSNPPAKPPYKLSPPELAELEKQLQGLLEHGFIQPSTSPYAAPVFFVKKPDGSLRMVVDWRGLNNITVKNKIALPNLEELFDQLGRAVIFSKLDLHSGFNQVPVREEDIPKTAIITRFGHFEFTVMGLGMSNAPATFQTLMNTVMQPFLGKFVVVFIDDILVFSESAADHLTHLDAVLTALAANKLYAKPSKCSFAQSSIAFLGHVFEGGRIFVDPAKTQSVQDWPVPRSVSEVRQFVGLANFFRRFVPKFASMVAALNDVLKAKRPLVWGAAQQRSFSLTKAALLSPPALRLPIWSRPFTVTSDASDVGLSAVLSQDGQPVAYWSAKCTPAEQRYTVDERETLAAVRSLQHWRHYLFNHFDLCTDSRVLRFILSKDKLTRRQAGFVEVLTDFDFTLRQIPGDLNVADALSRRADFYLGHIAACNVAVVAAPVATALKWSPEWLADVKLGYLADPLSLQLWARVEAALAHGPIAVEASPYCIADGLLWLRGDVGHPNRIFVPAVS